MNDSQNIQVSGKPLLHVCGGQGTARPTCVKPVGRRVPSPPPQRLCTSIIHAMLLAAFALLAGCAPTGPTPAVPAAAPKPPPPPLVFELTERFGVAHPEQIVTFDLPAGTPTSGVRVVDSATNAVPFQFVDGGTKLALRTDLPAGGSKMWRLETLNAQRPTPNAQVDTPSPSTLHLPPSVVTLAESDTCYELANGLTGVRVPKAVDCAATQQLPAPVQGVRMRDGTWAATGPNWLEYQSQADWTKKTAATGMRVTVLEGGPLRAVVRVDYRFEHPELAYGQQKLKPAGPGYYISTITLEAGQPSVLFEEETDFEPSWSIDLYEAVRPTHARYRGHRATDKRFGAGPDGGVYKGYQTGDAEVALTYDRPRGVSYRTADDTWSLMARWDPWCFDTGWYWQLFNRDAPESANVIGIFAGPASRALGAHMSGVGIHTGPPAEAGGAPRFGLSLVSYRRGPDARVLPLSRWSWGLYAGTRADVKPAAEVQPINIQMNLHGGVHLDKVHRWTLDFADPSEGYGTAFMGRAGIEALKARVREDEAYYRWLYNNDTYTRALFDAWRDPGREKLAACVSNVLRNATAMLDALVHRGGIYEMSVHYWHGGLTAQRDGVWIDQLLGDPRLTGDERARLKAAAVMYANVVWDDDHAPISSTAHGLNLGTENMPVQQWGYRRFYALFLARHPTMVARAAQVEAQLRATVDQVINDSGAEIGCPHYIGASFVPTINTLLQLKQLGRTDPFKTWPKLARFADFYLNLLTPPEPRMGNKPALVALGDSGLETSEIFGLLGTGFRDADPALSRRLMAAWAAGGKQHSFFFGTTTVMIDDALPAAPAPLGDATFPGYLSVLRHGWGTPDETALFFVNGDFYRDHRHYDHGSVVLYALGRPLSTDWSAIYTPHAPGGYMHSMVLPEAVIGHPWDKDGALLTAGAAVWRDSRQEAFETAADGAFARASFRADKLEWTRAVTVARSAPGLPVIVIRDSFSGENAAVPKVASLNLMAVGPVGTPAGLIEPPLRTHPNAQRMDDPAVLPSATRPMDLPAGVSAFTFTGRYDVDFAVFVIADEPRQALLGNWGNSAWGGAVSEREERQHILRVRGSGPFATVIVPWRRGARPEGLTVTREGDTLCVRVVDQTLRFGADGSL